MIDPERYLDILENSQISFFTGVPDSLMKDLLTCVDKRYPADRHFIAPNEGNAIAMAFGHYLATGALPLVYLQNSGLGNCINPLTSLADTTVYPTPMILLIGHRGHPDHGDEPQHFRMGQATTKLLDAIEIPYFDLPVDEAEATSITEKAISLARENKTAVALLVQPKTFLKIKNSQAKKHIGGELNRKDSILSVISHFRDKVRYFASTGHIGREAYEAAGELNLDINNIFLNVGAMGHTSHIALGYALECENPVVCLDGDGSLLMHLGGLVSLRQMAPESFVYVVLNNGAHVSVGGQATMIKGTDLYRLAQSLRFGSVHSWQNKEEVTRGLSAISLTDGPSFVEIKVSDDFDSNLIRPKESSLERLHDFMSHNIS